jgi:CheY-like chemotaxis protein
MMGGDLSVTSQPGKGSTFILTSRFGKQAGAGRFDPGGMAALAGKKVLVFGPESAQTSILCRHLAEWGMSCSRAGEIDPDSDPLPESPGEVRSVGFAILAGPPDQGESIRVLDWVRRSFLARGVRVFQMVSGTPLDHPFETGTGIEPLYAPVMRSRIRDLLVSPGPVDSGAGAQLPPSCAAGEPPARDLGPRVLLVEDNEVNQEVARAILEVLGCRVETVNNGAEALALSGEEAFDLIMMDCQMPVMDGFEATRRIREREEAEKRPPARIIALTAHAMRGDLERCLEVGMNDHLGKPFTVDELKGKLERWLSCHAPG